LLKHRYHKRIYLEDEMRGGTRTECKQRWAAEGSRPVCKVKLGYEFTYLYAAINPATGKLIALLLPDMTKASFGLFMEHFRVETKAVHGHHKVVMVADGAGSHQHQVCERYGVAFQKLPRTLRLSERPGMGARPRTVATLAALKASLSPTLASRSNH